MSPAYLPSDRALFIARNHCPEEWVDRRLELVQEACGWKHSRPMMVLPGYRGSFGKRVYADMAEYHDANWMPRYREARQQGNRRFV